MTFNSRQHFLNACAGKVQERPPVWIMRQAGRYLPEYRALKEKHGFLTMVRTPELATEVTLQPIRRFGFDAAVLFSDILVIPEAMGQAYTFRDQGGIAMEYAISSRQQVESLEAENIRDKLGYVEGALRLLRTELDGKTALLGFGGSPWTLATYMIEGGSSTHFQKVKELFYVDRELFDLLLEKITAAVIAFFEMQIEAGADALQIFDSWGGSCAGNAYEAASLRWIRAIARAVGSRVPVILYAKGLHGRMDELASSGVSAVSLDWTADLGRIRKALRTPIPLQGNLDPVLLNTRPEIVRAESRKILNAMEGYPGHIFNLGHGILPDARIENVEALVETVRS